MCVGVGAGPRTHTFSAGTASTLLHRDTSRCLGKNHSVTGRHYQRQFRLSPAHLGRRAREGGPVVRPGQRCAAGASRERGFPHGSVPQQQPPSCPARPRLPTISVGRQWGAGGGRGGAGTGAPGAHCGPDSGLASAGSTCGRSAGTRRAPREGLCHPAGPSDPAPEAARAAAPPAAKAGKGPPRPRRTPHAGRLGRLTCAVTLKPPARHPPSQLTHMRGGAPANCPGLRACADLRAARGRERPPYCASARALPVPSPRALHLACPAVLASRAGLRKPIGRPSCPSMSWLR